MRQNIIKHSLWVWLLVLPGILCAQLYDSAFYRITTNEYSGEQFVQLQSTNAYTISVKKEKLQIVLETTEKFFFLKEPPGKHFSQSVFSSLQVENEKIDARMYSFENHKYTCRVIKDFKERTNADDISFHNDTKETMIDFTGISKGAIVELFTRQIITDPHLLHTFFLGWSYPIAKGTLILDCDKNVELDLVKFNVNESFPEIKMVEEGSRKKYIVEVENVRKYKFEDYSPDERYFIPHIIPVIKTYKSGNQSIDVLNGLDALYAWYYSYIGDLEKDIDTVKLKALADSVTIPCTTDEEKVNTLFAWVQNNIKYIAFEYGDEGYIPRKADIILENKYGDCKDKASLLRTLLRLKGLNAYLTWVGSDDIPYSYHELPTPNTDNHMIVTCISNGEYYFLDGTGKFLRWNVPTSFIQNKEALIAKSPTEYEIKTIPVMPPEYSRYIDSVKITIQNNVIHGKGDILFTGYEKIFYQDLLVNENEKEQRKYVEAITEKGNNKYVLQTYNLPDLNSYRDTMSFKYSFELGNYINTSNKDLYINMNLSRRYLSFKPEKDRESPMKFRFCHKVSKYYELTLPQGYTVKHIPTDFTYEKDLFGFDISYQIKDNRICYTHNLYIKTFYIPMNTMKEWSDFISSLEQCYKQTIILGQASSDTPQQ